MSFPLSASAPSDSAHADAVREAVEAERLRLAQDLHDDLGGRLIALKMALAPLAKNASLSADAARADLLLDEAIEAMHAAMHQLRPRELDLGLVAALQGIAADFTSASSSASVSCRFSSDQAEIDASPVIALGLLRICREALANAVRHGQASTIDIRLGQSEIDGRDTLLLDITDNGKGYPAEAPDSASIAGRVQALNGILERRPGLENGAGCHLHIRVPMALYRHGNG